MRKRYQGLRGVAMGGGVCEAKVDAPYIVGGALPLKDRCGCGWVALKPKHGPFVKRRWLLRRLGRWPMEMWERGNQRSGQRRASAMVDGSATAAWVCRTFLFELQDCFFFSPSLFPPPLIYFFFSVSRMCACRRYLPPPQHCSHTRHAQSRRRGPISRCKASKAAAQLID